MTDRRCSRDGCGRGGKLVRGMCGRCYGYWLDHTPPEDRPVAPRFSRTFWDFVEKTHEHGCWTWQGSRDRKGYGRWSRVLTHRHSWSLANGPIPDGLWVLHHCDNPPCVNPRHLYLGTVVENVRDSVARGRNYIPPLSDQCPKGHALEGENLRLVNATTGIKRFCRICDNARSRDRQRLRRASCPKPVPPAGRIRTAEVLQRYDVKRRALFRWQQRGWVESVVIGGGAWWLPSEIEKVIERLSHRQRTAA